MQMKKCIIVWRPVTKSNRFFKPVRFWLVREAFPLRGGRRSRSGAGDVPALVREMFPLWCGRRSRSEAGDVPALFSPSFPNEGGNG
jgi:hypothetical protein